MEGYAVRMLKGLLIWLLQAGLTLLAFVLLTLLIWLTGPWYELAAWAAMPLLGAASAYWATRAGGKQLYCLARAASGGVFRPLYRHRLYADQRRANAAYGVAGHCGRGGRLCAQRTQKRSGGIAWSKRGI